MLEGHFYIRLFLNIIIGLMFAYAMYSMAKHNNQETEPHKHKVLHIIGWCFLGACMICLVSCIYFLTLVDFPAQQRGAILTPQSIVRFSTSKLYWGYPTMIQYQVLNTTLNIFGLLGLGAYFLYFKSSNSKWWKKLLKVLIVLFLYIFMASTTDFHYFDFWEFVNPALFLLLWYIIINRKNSQKNPICRSSSTPQAPNSNAPLCEEHGENVSTEQRTSKLAEVDTSEYQRPLEVKTEPKEQNPIHLSDGHSSHIQYCRYCGKSIEVDSNYCKYCGNCLDINHVTKTTVISPTSKDAFHSYWRWMVSLFKRQPEPNTNKSKRGRIFKMVAYAVVILIILGITSVGLLYYFEEIRPKHQAEKLLKTEFEALDKLDGAILLKRCREILYDHNIPDCGDEWRNDENLRELHKYAWGKVESLAFQGFPHAQFMLGVKYSGYDFIRKEWNSRKYNDGSYENPSLDYKKAAYWYLKAAEQNHSGAQCNLGRCYYNGDGVEVNMKESIKWYRLSAQNGDHYGELYLGDCFRDGCKIVCGEHWVKDPDTWYYDWKSKSGYHKVTDYQVLIEQNLDSALYYWKKSAAQGNEMAKDRLQQIY